MTQNHSLDQVVGTMKPKMTQNHSLDQVVGTMVAIQWLWLGNRHELAEH